MGRKWFQRNQDLGVMMLPGNDLMLPDDMPARADARKNRALLLETAQRLFAEASVDDVSMTAIADAAGVGKGTLYRHFDNKADICNALLDEDMRDLQEKTLKQLRDQADPAASLHQFLEDVIRFVVRNTAMLSVEMPDGSMLSHSAHLWWHQTILGLLTRLQPDDDVGYFAGHLYVMLDVRTIAFQRQHLGYDVEQIIAGVHDTLDRWL